MMQALEVHQTGELRSVLIDKHLKVLAEVASVNS